MKLVKTREELITCRRALDGKKKSIGFVPTMGSLHLGHLSLVKEASQQTDSVFVSIFVNPAQFDDPSDLEKYPRNLKKDLELLSEYEKIDVVFAPEINEMYPEPDKRIFNFGYLENIMEGQKRPGHFNGVAQIVSKLFEMVQPHKAFFGQKDFQQLVIIKNLVRQLNMNIEIVSCPIIRESDGLAMSSRNQLLNPEERKHAVQISKVLAEASLKASEMNVDNLKEWITFTLNKDPLIRVEYFEIVDPLKLIPVRDIKQPGNKVGCIAVKIGKVRLIDNLIFD